MKMKCHQWKYLSLDTVSPSSQKANCDKCHFYAWVKSQDPLLLDLEKRFLRNGIGCYPENFDVTKHTVLSAILLIFFFEDLDGGIP